MDTSEIKLEDIEIDLTKSVKNCVNGFFNHYEDVVEEHKNYISHKRIDYFKMKRFLFTAYNNLLDIDHTFFDQNLATLKESMMMFDSMYIDFKAKTKFPHLSYEYIFLDKQDHYMELSKRYTRQKSKVGLLKASSATYDAEIKKIQDYIKRLTKKDPKYDLAVKKLKKFKGNYVDSIHSLGVLRVENEILYEKLTAFKKQYEMDFETEFAKVVDLSERSLSEMLDSYAYKFDNLMWKEAADSKAIYEYFDNVGIIDDFSSKTFLKYYLNTLDNDKLNKSNTELKELLVFLEESIDLSIIVFDEENESLQNMYQLVSNVSEKYYVYKINEQKTLVNTLISKDVDILFIGHSSNFNSVLRLLSRMESGFRHEVKNISYCLLSDDLTTKEIMEARKYGITTFIKTIGSDEDITKKIEKFCLKVESNV